MQVANATIESSLQDVNPLHLKTEAFNRLRFDFIVNTPKGKHLKQEEALRILMDNETEEFLYGGAAGGAKSWTGCCWLLFSCLKFPGTRWFIGREELKRITESTLITFYKVASAYGCISNVDFKYNGQKNFIQFKNGSRIDLLELKKLPRDPLYERFGSTEYTGGWIEEAGEIDFGAYDVLKTRIGRQYNDKFGLIGKLFITCNPKKNWLYTTFYLPAKNGTLESLKKYLVAFVQDNPHIDSGYIERLRRTKDKAKKERLLNGNWEYDDDPDALCDYDSIVAMFVNNHVLRTGKKYITADVARYGSDKARILVWDGWCVIESVSFDISSTVDIQDAINALRRKHNIPVHHCIADEDGVGGGVVDNCGIKGFLNNSTALKDYNSETMKQNYYNLQTQCAYLLADIINEHSIFFDCELSPTDVEEIKEEISWLKTFKSDDEKQLYILPKKEVKHNIGRSPDWRDVMLMRVFFDLSPNSDNWTMEVDNY